MLRLSDDSDLWALLDRCAGTVRAARLFQVLEVEPRLLQARTRAVSRAVLAQALTMLLFEDVVGRVPMAAAYVGDALRAGRRLVFDHAPSGRANRC